MNQSNIKQYRAFTLIELLVVIAVIGVLIAVILPNLMGVRERARDTAKKNNLTQLKTALRLYYNDYNSYPDDDSGNIVCAAPGGSTTCGDSFVVGGETYMKELPSADYTYTQQDSGDGFLLTTVLENASDADVAVSANRCGVTAVDNTFYVCED